uniref:Glia maturation factor gamma n=1 Tax=Ornithorhynchus anatinus TaxID=9258 RepID=A0A6I8MZ25_ORNAN
AKETGAKCHGRSEMGTEHCSCLSFSGPQNISPDELKNELPERQFVVYSYKYLHGDGRVSYPLCFIFSSPVGCKPEQQMMYAGSKNRLVQAAELTKAQRSEVTSPRSPGRRVAVSGLEPRSFGLPGLGSIR